VVFWIILRGAIPQFSRRKNKNPFDNAFGQIGLVYGISGSQPERCSCRSVPSVSDSLPLARDSGADDRLQAGSYSNHLCGAAAPGPLQPLREE
jgi:hypothetical protein